MGHNDYDARDDGQQPTPALSGVSSGGTDACCKVQSVAKAHDLRGINEELRRRYESDDGTLHKVADHFNDRVTAVTLDELTDPPTAEPGMVRAALQAEESISPTKRDDIRAKLAAQVDIDQLTDAYVSHETIRRHLNEHLDVSTSQGGFETVAELQEKLTSYQSQYRNGVRSALERATEKGIIVGTTYRVFSTRVECDNCSQAYRLTELLEEGGCNCMHE